MRIQEMRSGRAYLARRAHGSRAAAGEQRHSLDVFPATAEEIDAYIEAEIRPLHDEKGPRAERSDLEKPQWSVVSFAGIEAGGLTYDQASRLVAILCDDGLQGLCVITDVAALSVNDAH